MFNIGPMELIDVLVIALLVFGPKKLPEIGRGIGNAMREFTKARNDFMEQIHSAGDYDEPVRSTSSVATDAAADAREAHTVDRTLEYPEPFDPESADALPYGGDFHAVEEESQPSFRTALPESAPVASAATSRAHTVDGKA